jgi:hypothetical protein
MSHVTNHQRHLDKHLEPEIDSLDSFLHCFDADRVTVLESGLAVNTTGRHRWHFLMVIKLNIPVSTSGS